MINSSAHDNGCYQKHENLTLKSSFLSTLYWWLTEVKWILFQKTHFAQKLMSPLGLAPTAKPMVTAVGTQALLQGWCLSPKKNQFVKCNTFISVAKYPNFSQQCWCDWTRSTLAPCATQAQSKSVLEEQLAYGKGRKDTDVSKTGTKRHCPCQFWQKLNNRAVSALGC